MQTQKRITWTVGLRLAIGVAALFVIMASIIGIGVWTNNQISDEIDLVNDLRTPTFETSSRAEADFMRALADIRGYLSLGESQFRESAQRNMGDFEVALAELEQLSANWTNPENITRLEKIKAAYTAWSPLPEQMFALRDDPLANEPARKILFEQAAPLGDTLITDITTLIDEQGTRSFAGDRDAAAGLSNLKNMADFRGSLALMLANIRGYLATGEIEFIDKFEVERAKNEAAWTKLNEHKASLTGSQAAKLAEMATARSEFARLPEQMFAIHGSERQREDLYLLRTRATPKAAEIVTLLGEMRDDQATLLTESLKLVQEAGDMQIWLTLLTGGIGLVIGATLTWFNTRSILDPLREVTATAAAMAGGNLSQRANVSSRDELGILADAFNKMADNLGQMIETERQAKETLQNTVVEYVTFTNKVSGGDLSGQLALEGDEDNPLVKLGSNINSMVANLRPLIGQVIEAANSLGEASAQLTTTAEQASQASQQVASTIQQVAQGTTQQTQAVTAATGNVEQIARAADSIAQGAQEQAKGVQKTATLVDEMAWIVAQVGQGAQAVGQATTKVTQAARNGVMAVDQTGQGMEIIRARANDTAGKVKEMIERSKEISRIVDTIDEIADKTDMLALNAAVEAARAGEHGRGFAVVAEQVRKLSEDSKEATRDIGQLIERVQEAVNQAITATDSTVHEVNVGSKLAEETARSLQDILQAAEEAASLAGQIGGAVSQLKEKSEGVVGAMEAVSAVVEENTSVAEEMAAGSQEAMKAMEGVASVAEENSASAEEVSAAAEEMSAQVEEVVASAQELSLVAEQLLGAVAQFKVDQIAPAQSTPPRHVFDGRKPQAAPVAHQTNSHLVRVS
jgi:methyl-accepting chemotaxis protein